MINYLIVGIKNYKESYSGLNKTCWQGMILNLFESTLIGIYYFLPLYFINQLHFSIVQSGIIISFYGFGTILGGYLGGKLSDRFNPSLVSIFSIFIQAIMFLILIYLKTFTLLSINLFILGIASYSFITANHLWVLNHCENENKRLKALNIISVFSNLGLGLSAFFISFFIDHGIRYIVYFSAALLLLSGIYFLVLETRVNLSPISKEPIEKKDPISLGRNSLFWLSLICLFLVGFIIFQANTTYSIFISNRFAELGTKSIGILFALNSFLVVFFQPVIVNFFRNHNKVFLMGVGAFLLGISMFMLNFTFFFSIAILACIVNTIGEMLFFSVAQLICYQNSPHHKKGFSLGLYRMTYASSRVLSPTVGGFIYQQLGGNILWLVCGLIGVISLFLCNFFKK